MIFTHAEVEWKRQLGAWYVQGTRIHVMRKMKAGAGPVDLGDIANEIPGICEGAWYILVHTRIYSTLLKTGRAKRWN